VFGHAAYRTLDRPAGFFPDKQSALKQQQFHVLRLFYMTFKRDFPNPRWGARKKPDFY